MQLPIYQVDAFTDSVFGGNPAAVCPLEEWLPDEVLQSIALENNLSETAFFVCEGDSYRLRWFTPALEVALCGHATLAGAHVIFEELAHDSDVVRFESQSGELRVTRKGQRLVLDLPARPGEICRAPEGLLEALGGQSPVEVRGAAYWLVAYEDEAAVRALAPEMRALARHAPVIATAPGTETDFISRFFAPSCGVDEDPVTGSAHCTLAPYWAERLGKSKLTARQISKRTGELVCEVRGERVLIEGRAVLYLRGTIYI
jgi:PhzF family phenazine biosynthesis protein